MASILRIDGMDYIITPGIAGRIENLLQRAERDEIPADDWEKERFALCRTDGKGKMVVTFKKVIEALKQGKAA